MVQSYLKKLWLLFLGNVGTVWKHMHTLDYLSRYPSLLLRSPNYCRSLPPLWNDLAVQSRWRPYLPPATAAASETSRIVTLLSCSHLSASATYNTHTQARTHARTHLYTRTYTLATHSTQSSYHTYSRRLHACYSAACFLAFDTVLRSRYRPYLYSTHLVSSSSRTYLSHSLSYL